MSVHRKIEDVIRRLEQLRTWPSALEEPAIAPALTRVTSELRGIVSEVKRLEREAKK